ncbi:hypothetical protein V5799_017038 [Amblyomma americanum]|uniref:Uncharacterized protein n=1 Tax=Amblyomma americanum TaxID=6943 RepID=A0AAQ4F3D9_AMBAM
MDGNKGLNGSGSLSVMARHFSRAQGSPRTRSFSGLPGGAAVSPGPMGQHRPTFELQQPWSPYDASLALYAQLVSRKCLAVYDEPCASGSVVAGVIAIVGAPVNVPLFVTAIERRYNFTHLSAVIDRNSKYKNSVLDSKEDAGDKEELVKSTAQVGQQAMVALNTTTFEYRSSERDLSTTNSTAATATGSFWLEHGTFRKLKRPTHRWSVPGLLDTAIVIPDTMKKHRSMSVLQHPRLFCDPSLVPYLQQLERECLVAYDSSCASCMQAAGVPLLFGAPDNILLFGKASERYKNFSRKNPATCRLSKHKEAVPDNQEEQAAQLVKTTVHIGHYATVVRSLGVLVPLPHGPHCNVGAPQRDHVAAPYGVPELEASAGFMDGNKGLNGSGPLSVMARHFSRTQGSPRKRRFVGLPDGADLSPGSMGQLHPTLELHQPCSPYDDSVALYAQLVSRKCLAAYDSEQRSAPLNKSL